MRQVVLCLGQGLIKGRVGNPDVVGTLPLSYSAQANVEPALVILQNVDPIGSRHPAVKLVAGVGFEPTAFRL